MVALAVLFPLAGALAAALAGEETKGANKAEFLKAFTGPDTHQGALAIEKLNPDVKSDYELLKMVLSRGNWHYRAAAAKVLAKAGNPDVVKDMIESLTEKGEKNPYVRQGMAIAIAKMNDRTLYPELFKALDDKEPRVRRQVAYVLRINKDKGSIEALINRWKEEKDPLVCNYIRESLEDITKRYIGLNQVDWYNWWLANKEKFEVGSTDEEAAKKAEQEGKKLSEGTTTTRDVDVNFVSRGVGVPVIVLPHYGLSKEMMIPFFYEIERIAKVAYMDNPPISKFKNLKSVGGIPYYPIDALVEAFEEFRKAQKADRIAIMACGMDSWIAMRYAAKYPKNVVGLIFVAPISSDKEYGAATKRMKDIANKTGDIELEHYALTRTFNTQTGESTHDEYHKTKNLPKPEGEDEAIHRKDFDLFFNDRMDSLLEQLYPIAYNPPGSVAIPDFSVAKEGKVGVPVLVVSGKHSIYTSESDCALVAKQYGAQLVSFEKSACVPFVEEPQKFNEVVKNFLTKHLAKRPK
jgi:pimeloyl-ACP methyl ester carboxylesterase